jgi:Mg-chelatase subunit ChlD
MGLSDWIRRNFDACGVTQWRPGPHLSALQEPLLGKVILCIDVSGSMSGANLAEAVSGARQFVAQAVAAHYRVGLILWNSGVQSSVPPTADPTAVLLALDGARASGGTDVTPTLRLGIAQLGGLQGDRVLAVFGDGDIGPVEDAVRAARDAASAGIRIVVRGLGVAAAGALAQLATDDSDRTVIQSGNAIATGIASMAGALRHLAPRTDG